MIRSFYWAQRKLMFDRIRQVRARIKSLKLKQALIKRLGNKCAMCGEKVDLTIDHKKPRQYDSGVLGMVQRIQIYLQEEKRDELQVLCFTCNRIKGRKIQPF